ncbi:MAG TPA: tripartite tricarboxylate transporter TctB family protein [Burkholderiales bacterium]|nr:tripartite tricarboxylate transporter TctB family protein [Burkholderiales bacterium]
MRSADRVTAALLLALSVAFSAGALKYYSWWGSGGPGSAFLPFWLGIVMALLALMLLVRSLKEKNPGEAWLPRGEGLRNMVVVLGATVLFVALLNVLGMVLGTALYLAGLIWYLGRHRWWVTVAIAVAAAGFNWLVFVHWLRVPFPEGMFWTS